MGRSQEHLLEELLALGRAALASQQGRRRLRARRPAVEPLAPQLRTAPPDGRAVFGHERFEGLRHGISSRSTCPDGDVNVLVVIAVRLRSSGGPCPGPSPVRLRLQPGTPTRYSATGTRPPDFDHLLI